MAIKIEAVEIEPICLQSSGGYPVVLKKIFPLDHDCLEGQITTPGNGLETARWNLVGIMRGGAETCNLKRVDIAEVVEIAKKVGAKD